MARRTVVVTGAAGFLGSAVTVDLAADHDLVALDRRAPGRALRDAAPLAVWHRVDVGERDALTAVLREARRHFKRIDVLVHFAAHYDFGTDWGAEYQRTNVDGTTNVVEAAIESGVRRLIFASSILAMPPPARGTALTEKSPTTETLPYAKSKAIGERIVREAASRVPAITLRIGGVFSDWCELPPLYGLIETWTRRPPLNRLLVGEGETGFPYVHLDDLVRLVRRCVGLQDELALHETFLASQHGGVHHRELFEAVHGAGTRALRVSRATAHVGLALQRALGRVTRRMPFERSWMLAYVDRPWVADTRVTREKLGWDCTPELDLRARLPVLLEHLRGDGPTWRARKAARLARDYRFGRVG